MYQFHFRKKHQPINLSLEYIILIYLYLFPHTKSHTSEHRFGDDPNSIRKMPHLPPVPTKTQLRLIISPDTRITVLVRGFLERHSLNILLKLASPLLLGKHISRQHPRRKKRRERNAQHRYAHKLHIIHIHETHHPGSP